MFVCNVASVLSGGGENHGDWSQSQSLRFPYPAALHLADWVLAPYALEWCARYERPALGTGTEPRGELLARLYPDALGRVGALGKQAKWSAAIIAIEVDSRSGGPWQKTPT